VFVHDRQTGGTERISQAPDGSDANSQSLFAPHLNSDRRFVYFTSFASNTASVRGQEPEADPADNTATETTTVLPR
jgi:hypothetical protein